MKIDLESHFNGVSGGCAGSSLVFYTRDGVVLARSKGDSRGKRTPQRTLGRAIFGLASKAWLTLTPEQRMAWQAYADSWFRASPHGERLSVNAQNVFTKAHSIRQVLGLAMIADAPLLGPPSPPVEATVEPSTAPDEFSFGVHHGYGDVDGHFLLARITRATCTVARMPRVRGVVTFAGARLSIDDGKRFGFEIRIARQCDGMTSPPLWRDTIRRIG